MPLTIKCCFGDSIRRLKLPEVTIESLQELVAAYYGPDVLIFASSHSSATTSTIIASVIPSTKFVIESTQDLLNAIELCPNDQLLKLELVSRHAVTNVKKECIGSVVSVKPVVTVHVHPTDSSSLTSESKNEEKERDASIVSSKVQESEHATTILGKKQRKQIHWASHPLQGLRNGAYTRAMYQQRHREMFGPQVPPKPAVCPSYDLINNRKSGNHNSRLNQKKFNEKKKSSQVDEDDDWVKVDPLAEFATSVTFTINQEQFTVTDSDINPRMMLSEYLREVVGLTGTKVGCGEGGCGACTVVIARPSSTGDKVYTSANACLRPVFSLDNAVVYTTEGLGNISKGLSPVQAAIVNFDGTQCGMCTPGMVMSMYSLLCNSTEPTKRDIEMSLQGNLCRCTGYRSILEGFHGFAPEAKQQQQQQQSCSEKKKEKQLLQTVQTPEKSYFQSADAMYFNVSSVAEVFSVLALYPSQPYRLAVGNTSVGVIKYYPPVPEDDPSLFINIAHVPELTTITQTANSVSFGASVTLANVLNTFEVISAKNPSILNIAALARHFQQIAHPQVRGVGSWIGNVMLAKSHPQFPSDVVLCLTSVQAVLTLIDNNNVKTQVNISDFLTNPFPKNSIVYSVTIPFSTPADYFDTYKVMLRHANSHALVNAGFNFTLSGSVTTGFTIESSRIVFGALILGPLICVKTQRALTKMPLTQNTFSSILSVLLSETVCAPDAVDPPYVITDPTYRQALAVNLFYKFFLSAIVKATGQSSIPFRYLSAVGHYERDITSGKPSFPLAPAEENPLGLPVHKVEGGMQASGESLFTADLPRLQRTLVAVPVCATQLGTVTKVDVTKALATEGVKGFISASDCLDLKVLNQCAAYQIFITDKVSYVGQFIGLILATTELIAFRASKLVYVEYKTSPAAITSDKATEGNEFPVVFTAPSLITGAKAVKGSMTTTGQKHFFLETQVTYAVPEEGKLQVHVATQAISFLKNDLQKTLQNAVTTITVDNTRVGGAYGGKAYQPQLVSAAASIAALKMRVPVLFQLNRNDDMRSMGGRAPCQTDFSASFDPETFKITGLTVTANVNAGEDAKAGATNCVSLNAYQVPSAVLASKPFASNTPVNTIMRAPGHFQGALFTEAAIEAIMQASGVTGTKDQLKIQEANMLSGFDVVWSSAKQALEDNKIAEDVDSFNGSNRWRKRGWYIAPVFYTIGSNFYVEKLLIMINSNGTVVVDHSGIEVGQGINTKVVQAVAYALSSGNATSVDMSMINMFGTKSTDTFSNVEPTYGSGTSEVVVACALKACAALNLALKPYQSAGNWQQIVAAAVSAGVDLSASATHEPDEGGSFPITCSALSVVEIDVLTGECQVLRVDIFYDCGISLNPAVDAGQVEGCFIQAMGFMLTEEQVRSKVDSRLINNGTWDYKPPSALDIPIQFNTTFIKSVNTLPGNVMGSKASGEPGYLLAHSVFFAVKNAIYAARIEAGHTEYFQLDLPASPARVCLACLGTPQ